MAIRRAGTRSCADRGLVLCWLHLGIATIMQRLTMQRLTAGLMLLFALADGCATACLLRSQGASLPRFRFARKHARRQRDFVLPPRLLPRRDHAAVGGCNASDDRAFGRSCRSARCRFAAPHSRNRDLFVEVSARPAPTFPRLIHSSEKSRTGTFHGPGRARLRSCR
jgi:hypothetical protein